MSDDGAMSDDGRISVERVIDAPPERIFEVLVDPGMHPVIDGSTTVRRPLPGNPERLAEGAKFGMAMKIGMPYRIRNTVVEFEEGRRIAWRHLFHHRWRYELEPTEGGTRVTETFDFGASWAPRAYYRLFRFPEKNREGMVKTLERLEEVVTERSSPEA